MSSTDCRPWVTPVSGLVLLPETVEAVEEERASIGLDLTRRTSRQADDDKAADGTAEAAAADAATAATANDDDTDADVDATAWGCKWWGEK